MVINLTLLILKYLKYDFPWLLCKVMNNKLYCFNSELTTCKQLQFLGSKKYNFMVALFHYRKADCIKVFLFDMLQGDFQVNYLKCKMPFAHIDKIKFDRFSLCSWLTEDIAKIIGYIFNRGHCCIFKFSSLVYIGIFWNFL